MADNREKPTEEIEDILSKIKEEYKVGNITESKNENGATEFVFREEPHGLVFEEEKPKTPSLLEHEKSAPKVEETVLVDSEKDKKKEETPLPAGEEFLVPENFSVNEKYNTPVAEEDRPRIWTTYLPRFTEVSETYRMVNDPRPRTGSSTAVNSAATRKVSPSDPTAENDTTPVAMAKEVNVNTANPDPEENLIKVAKPSARPTESEPKNEPKPEPTLEEEREKIREIIGDERMTKTEAPKAEEQTAKTPEREEGQTVYDFSDKKGAPAVMDYGVSDVYGEKISSPKEDEPLSILTPDGKKGKSADYTSFSQRFAFKDRFVDAIASLRVRFIAAAVLTFILLLLENLGAVGVDPVKLLRLSSLPGALALLDLEFLACLFAIGLPETIAAVRALLVGRAKCELFLPVAFLFNIVYCLVIAAYEPVSYPLFGALYGVATLTAIASSYFAANAEFMSFKLVSINGKKQVVEKKMTRSLERENLALDGTIDEYKSKTARFFRTTFVSDFFRRNSKSAENSQAVLLLFAVTLGVSLVTGVVAYFIVGGMVGALASFLLVFMLSFPSFGLLSHKLSYYRAEKETLAEDSTVIGETSYYDYAGVDVVTFDDIEIFGKEDVALQRVMLYGDKQNFTKALRQMSALFALLGGPLDYIFANALEKRCPPAEHAYVEQDGIRGEVEGVTVYAGTEEYMRRYGITIPADTGAQDRVYDTTRVMYAAEAGRVYAKFYLRYSFSEEYTMLLPLLKEAGIVTLVYTRDPNVNNELVHKLTTGEDIIRVMHKTVPLSEDKKIYPRISAGIVTLGDKTNAINMLLLSKKYVKFQKTLRSTATAAAAAGGAAAILLSLFGVLGIPTVFLALWQAAWVGVLAFLTRNTFPVGKQRNRKEIRETLPAVVERRKD